MREIKFRGKTIDGQQWVFGSLIILEDGRWLIKEIDRLRHIAPEYLVTPKTVGQFTKLKDYDGKEIYEGDILRDTEGRTFHVVWNIGAGAWEMVGIGNKFHRLFAITYPSLHKVIGNVHDDPGLVGVSHDHGQSD